MRLFPVTALTLVGLILTTGTIVGFSATREPAWAEIAPTEPVAPSIPSDSESDPAEPLDPSAPDPIEPSKASTIDPDTSPPEPTAPRPQRRMKAQERRSGGAFGPTEIEGADSDSGSADVPLAPRRQRRGIAKQRQNIFRNLNLSADQRQRIGEVRQRYKDELRDRQEIARQAREALRSLRTRNASPEEIQSQVRDLRRAQNAVRQIRNKQKLAMRDILTPEQWRQFNQATRGRKWAKGTTRRQKLNDDSPERQPGLSDPIRYPDPTLY